ncbi:Ribosome-binding protein 1 [Armadillidium vulgare]|nr:Ribosome-binding protein 1 [Armadillidium vulgare]
MQKYKIFMNKFKSSIIIKWNDAYLEPSKIARKSLYNYLLNGARHSSIPSNKNPSFSNYIQNKYFLSRPVRRIGSEFLGKRSLASFPIRTDEEENVNKENRNLVAFKGIPLNNFNDNSKFLPQMRNKRGVNSFENRRMKSLYSFLLRNRDDYFGKRFGYYSKGKPYTPYGYNRDIVGSEFLGKRSPDSSEFDQRKVNGVKDSIEDNYKDEIVHNKELKINPDSLNSESEEFFRGQIAADQTKRALGSEFLGKRGVGIDFSGKRALGSEFLGKRALGSEFLGKRALGSEFLGKRALGSEFLGKRALGSEFLGKRALGYDFLEKKAIGSEFLGKRNEGMSIFLKGNNKQGSLKGEGQNFEYFPQNLNFDNFQILRSGNYSQLPQLLSSEIHEDNLKDLNSNNIYPLYKANTPSKYYNRQS